jgi:predicted phage terminase large subunit-like protein
VSSAKCVCGQRGLAGGTPAERGDRDRSRPPHDGDKETLSFPRIPLDQIVRKTIVFCDQYQPHRVGFEADQFQELLFHEFRRQCGTGFRWSIHGLETGGVPKVSRIRRLSQFLTNREYRFKADSPGCRLLVDQLMDFPLADHDDGPDAMEMCLRLVMQD